MKAITSPMLPNGDMEIVFSFDTTGSMSHCLPKVRSHLQEIMERLFADIPGLKVAIFAHGDYCDITTYVTKYIDFTNNVHDLCKFVKGVSGTGGGDSDECYELVLHQVQTELTWSPGSQRALVMIGDANPHPPSYPDNKLKLNWEKETARLRDMGVTIYGVNCGGDGAKDFFNFMSEETGGRMIPLDDFSSITQMLMAVCYREKGSEFFEAFEREMRANREKITRTLSGVFDALRPEDEAAEPAVSSPKPRTSRAKITPKPKKAKATAAKRKRVPDEDVVTPVVKRRRSSVTSSTGSTHSSSSSKVGHKRRMATRSHKHSMTLRKRPAILYGRVEKKSASRTPVKSPRPVKINREAILAKQFVDSVEWAPWRMAMTKPTVFGSTQWSPRPGSRKGMRNDSLFEDMESPAVYEFAVATPGSSSKYPVYASVTKGFKNQSWENKFLGRSHLQKQIDCVLRRNCQIYARRAPVKHSEDGTQDVTSAVTELRHLLATSYDYAWQEHYNIETRTYDHRRLYKNGVLISE